MLSFRANQSFILLVVVFAIQVVKINSLNDQCQINTDCPPNAVCGIRNLCVCEPGFILNCSMAASMLSGISNPYPISAVETYYIIEPQALYEFIKFSVLLSTTQNQTAEITVNFWGETGYLTDLSINPKLEVLNIELNATSPATIQTTYFQFGLQPNGQPQMLYMGLQLKSTTLTSLLATITLEQIPAYNENIFKIILTILMGILSVSCFIMLGFCIYRKRRMNQMRQRAIQEKQIKPTEHFDQYMPKVSASRVNLPLQVCSVCLTDITVENEVRLTICKHMFHADCIDSWCKKNTSCPICRQQLDLQSCQNILGQDFDLSESLSVRKISENHKNQVDMMNKSPRMKKMSHLNEVEMVEENSMRRHIL